MNSTNLVYAMAFFRRWNCRRNRFHGWYVTLSCFVSFQKHFFLVVGGGGGGTGKRVEYKSAFHVGYAIMSKIFGVCFKNMMCRKIIVFL